MTQDEMMTQRRDIRAYKMLSEEPEYFEAETKDGETKKYTIYPFQLARLALISSRLIELELALDMPDCNPIKAMWMMCATKARKVAEIIAIATLKTQEDIEQSAFLKYALRYWKRKSELSPKEEQRLMQISQIREMKVQFTLTITL